MTSGPGFKLHKQEKHAKGHVMDVRTKEESSGICGVAAELLVISAPSLDTYGFS